jgi:predicted  nucleic acid-binding Zn-ribbon protein
MGLKEAYQEKLEAQLKEWSAKAKELQAKAETAKADAKVELQKHLDSLRAKQEAAQEKLKEIKEAGAAAWEKTKPGVEKAMADLSSAWERIKKHFS